MERKPALWAISIVSGVSDGADIRNGVAQTFDSSTVAHRVRAILSNITAPVIFNVKQIPRQEFFSNYDGQSVVESCGLSSWL
jgi:hypothetical protein